MKTLKNASIIAFIAGAFLLTGCASNKDLAEVRAMAEQAMADAQAANAKADEALASSEDANAKIDNMFKKAMQK